MMSEPTQADRDKAREIVTRYANPSQYDDNLEDQIGIALAAARDEGRAECKAPKGCIVDDQGVVRKVVAQSMGATFLPPDHWVHILRVEATNEEAFQACVAAKGGA